MKHWWKIVAVILILYTIIGGFLLPVPRLNILNETIRNLYFHVPMWFSMIALLAISLIYSIKHLDKFTDDTDGVAREAAITGFILGLLGLFTGMVWAKFTWNTWWTGDPKLIGAAVTLLTYSAYFVLRGSIEEQSLRGRVSAVYNIFAFVILIVFLFIYPRMNPSLHPGMDGNPAFSEYDLSDEMRIVFYPAVVGWILFSVWILSIRVRINRIKISQ